ncbi:MAG: flagellar basal body-associated FliL family protein [Edaphobacter sp.]
MSVLLLVLLGAAIASMGFGGVLYYLARSGRLSMRGAAAIATVPPARIATHLMALDPILVNLADTGGSSYLRLSLTLQVTDATAKKDVSARSDKSSDDAVAAVRDTALTVLGSQTSDNLLVPEGKDRLKLDLKRAFAEHNADLKVKELFFTDFLVQR